ncbi:hypothetical protein ACFC8N_45435 [Streptomyces sp. NPDC055966]
MPRPQTAEVLVRLQLGDEPRGPGLTRVGILAQGRVAVCAAISGHSASS